MTISNYHPFSNLNRNFSFLASAAIGIGVGETLCIYIHEVAHAVAMKLIFANSQPTIEWGFKSGLAHYNFKGPETMTALGELLGYNLGRCMIHAAGYLSTFLALIPYMAINKFPLNSFPINIIAHTFFSFSVTLFNDLNGEVESYYYSRRPNADFTKIVNRQGILGGSIFAIGCNVIAIAGIYKLFQHYNDANPLNINRHSNPRKLHAAQLFSFSCFTAGISFARDLILQDYQNLQSVNYNHNLGIFDFIEPFVTVAGAVSIALIAKRSFQLKEKG